VKSRGVIVKETSSAARKAYRRSVRVSALETPAEGEWLPLSLTPQCGFKGSAIEVRSFQALEATRPPTGNFQTRKAALGTMKISDKHRLSCRTWRALALPVLLILLCSPKPSNSQSGTFRDIAKARSLDPNSEASQCLAFIDKMADRSAAATADYHSALLQIAWDSLLSGDRLAKDEGLVVSQGMVSEAKRAKLRYDSVLSYLLLNVPNEVRRLDISEELKHSFLNGMQAGVRDLKAESDSVKSLEWQILSSHDSVIKMLKMHEGKWSVHNEKIFFESYDATNRFEELIDHLLFLAARQQFYATSLQMSQRAKSHRLLEALPR
jgi:hypothetical protein